MEVVVGSCASLHCICVLLLLTASMMSLQKGFTTLQLSTCTSSSRLASRTNSSWRQQHKAGNDNLGRTAITIVHWTIIVGCSLDVPIVVKKKPIHPYYRLLWCYCPYHPLILPDESLQFIQRKFFCQSSVSPYVFWFCDSMHRQANISKYV